MNCELANCSRPSRYVGPGLCELHYSRKKKFGSTELPVGLTDEERFWAGVDPCRTDGCMMWIKGTSKGYGVFTLGGETIKAYWFLAGKAPKGLEWDHLCRNRRCVWPEHLEAVPKRVNILRGEGMGARAARKTHCSLGHPLSGENLYIDYQGYRVCRQCQRRYTATYLAKVKGR